MISRLYLSLLAFTRRRFKIFNKKGIGLAIYGVVAFLLIIIVLIVFWVFFVIPNSVSVTTQSIVANEKIDADLTLLNYLKTPVTISGKQMLVSDLIRLYYNDPSHEAQLKTETKKIFDNVFSDYTYQLKIENKIISESSKKYTLGKKNLNANNIVSVRENVPAQIELEVNLD